MKKLLLLLSIIGISACKNANESSKKEVKQYTIEQFYKNKNITGSVFSSDDKKLLASSDETGIYNAWEYPVDGSAPVQLTHDTLNSIFTLDYFPNDNRILYSSDKGGNEISHLYIRNEDGSVRDITPDSGAVAHFLTWSRDEKSFFYGSNKRDPRFFDLYEMNIETLSPHMVYMNTEGMDADAVSDDKSMLLISEAITTSNSNLYLYDIASKNRRLITPHEGDVSNTSLGFSHDNKSVNYLTDDGSDFAYVIKYNIADSNKENVFKTNWDVAYASNSYNDHYRIVLINEDGKNTVKVFDLKDNKEISLPKIEDGDISGATISKSEKLMRLTVGGSKAPSNIYVYNFETKDLKQITNTLNPEINPDDLVTAEVVRFKSFDGLEIPAIYYRPLTASKENKVPALVWVHGGPGGQSRIGYFAFVQYLSNHGYAILEVNNRGSSGYGKEFFKMDDRNHGDKDLKDCVAGKDWLASQNYVDSNKIGILGGSYGGYMVLAALCFTPDEFNAGVDLFGVANWKRTLKSIPPYWESFRKALYVEMGNPETEDSVMLNNTSPLLHADQIRKPLMVLQGANDPRVLKVESDEIVAAVKKNNVPVEYVVFPDEGHGFLKKENEIKGYGQVLEFLNRYLGPAADSSVARK